ncbi:MAG: hypothetical protein ABI763_13265, partial [Bacteroidota bacterium]
MKPIYNSQILSQYTTTRKAIATFAIIFLCGMLSGNQVLASHAAGADLTYAWQGGNSYRVTGTFYRDCDGIAAPATITVNVKSASTQANSNFVLPQLPPTGEEITFPCISAQTKCTDPQSNLLGYQRYVYQADIVLPSPGNAADWVFSYSVTARNCAITTIVQPANCNPNNSVTPIYVEATLNNLNFAGNSSPVFSNFPVAIVCQNQAFTYNHGGLEADGDVLVYELIDCKTSATGIVPYIAPFSGTNPITSLPAVAINSATGDITMNPQNLEVGITAVRIKEYRNGVLIGSVIRDIEFYVQNCNPNVLPTATGINGTNNFSLTVCANSLVSFFVNSNDANAGQVVTMTTNNGISGATFGIAGSPYPTGTFSWTPGVANVRVAPYTFTVTVRDNNCDNNGFQIYSYSIYVTAVSATATTTQGVACGGTNGITNVTATGGTVPYSYLWSNGATTQSANGLSAGTYTATVTDATGCTSSSSTTLSPGSAPACSITCGGAICQGSSMQMCAPVGAASYLWSTGATTQCISGNTAGPFTVTVTDANGCSSSCSTTMIVNTPPTCSITGNSSVCNGGSEQWCAPAGLAGYSWSTGASTQCITVSAAGSYTVTITDVNGCTSVCSSVFSITACCNVTDGGSITGSQISCGPLCNITLGSSAAASGGSGTIEYLWLSNPLPNYPNNGSNGWVPIANSNSETLTIAGCITTTTYYIRCARRSGCPSYPGESNMVSIIINTPPTCLVSGNSYVCQGGQTQLCSPAGFASYSWSNGATTQCITIGLAGTYTVIVTDGNGCTSSCDKQITSSSPAPCSITGNNSVCTGNSTQWCATAGAASYLWSTGATTQCITVSAAGTYTATLTDASGCTTACSSVLTTTACCNVTDGGSITGSQISCGPLCNITLGSSAAASGGSGTIEYLWLSNPLPNYPNNGSNGWVPIANSNSETLTIAGCITTTTYYIRCARRSGCPSYPGESNMVSIIINTPPTCAISCGGAICQGGTMQMCAPVGLASYLWNTGATTQCITGSSAGTYSVTVTSANGCSSSCSTTLTV